MNKHPLLILVIFLFSFQACTSNKETTTDIIKKDFDFASIQLKLAIAETEKAIADRLSISDEEREKQEKNPLIVPRTMKPDGSITLINSRDWCSGFFPGELWYMYEYTKDESWADAARKYTAPIEREKTNPTTHDMGFKVFCSFGNGYRLTNDENYKKIIIESAYTLATRYNPNVKALRSWDHGRDKWGFPVIIDNMMNLELLFWAFRQTNDSTLYKVAVDHADTTLKNHFRNDYSSFHVIDYDTITGVALQKHTHQGYAHESAWSRGQAWAIYGYTMSYRETQKPEYLEQAKAIVNYIFSHPNMPEDLIPYWDYNAPNIPNEPRDVSAATVTASALYELSLYDKANATKYKKWADTILENLSKAYLAKENGDCGFLLLHSTGSVPGKFEVDAPLSYADYYFLEALVRKQKLEQTGKIF